MWLPVECGCEMLGCMCELCTCESVLYVRCMWVCISMSVVYMACLYAVCMHVHELNMACVWVGEVERKGESINWTRRHGWKFSVC